MENKENIVDINTLTEEQKKQIGIWYTFQIDENGQLLAVEPEEKTPEFIEYKTNIINKDFERSCALLTEWYTAVEINSWERKIAEAKKVVAGETSDFLDALCVEGEKVLDLAKLILARADAYAIEFAKIEKRKREALKSLNA